VSGDGATYTRKRYHHGGGFVHATNDFARNVPSTDAVAIWLRLYSHQDGWEFTVKSIAAEWNISFKRAETAIRLLRDLGYCHFCRVSLGRGKFESWYDLTDVPVMACGEQQCVDCAARSSSVSGSQKQPPDTTCDDTPVSAGRIGWSDYGVRKTTTQVEEHLLEDQEDKDLKTFAQAGSREPESDALFLVPEQPKPAAGRARKPGDLTAFDEFWRAYPRKKGGKAGAQRKFLAALRQASAETIIAAAAAFADRCERARTEEQFIPYPSTWLHQGRWTDEHAEEEPEAAAAAFTSFDI
jgi:hypothetical protein